MDWFPDESQVPQAEDKLAMPQCQPCDNLILLIYLLGLFWGQFLLPLKRSHMPAF